MQRYIELVLTNFTQPLLKQKLLKNLKLIFKMVNNLLFIIKAQEILYLKCILVFIKLINQKVYYLKQIQLSKRLFKVKYQQKLSSYQELLKHQNIQNMQNKFGIQEQVNQLKKNYQMIKKKQNNLSLNYMQNLIN